MVERLKLVLKYIRYWCTSLNGKGHGIHSPFVYDFVVQVLDAKNFISPGFSEIEAIRKQFCNSKIELEVEDLGAGSKFNRKSLRTIGSIAKSAAKPPKYAQLLYRLVKHYKVDHVLELGTSLGLTTRYFALAQPTHGVFTIEGAPAIAAFTKSQLLAEHITNVKIYEGDFNDHLVNALQGMQGRKLIFVDGNHDEVATLHYFNQIIKWVQEEDIIVFDDIRWSPGMQNAWKEIQKCKQVTYTIDLFFIGIVLFRKEFKEKLDFAIRF